MLNKQADGVWPRFKNHSVTGGDHVINFPYCNWVIFLLHSHWTMKAEDFTLWKWRQKTPTWIRAFITWGRLKTLQLWKSLLTMWMSLPFLADLPTCLRSMKILKWAPLSALWWQGTQMLLPVLSGTYACVYKRKAHAAKIHAEIMKFYLNNLRQRNT